MDNLKTPKYYIEKIIADIEFIVNNMKNTSLEEFTNDELLTSAISFKFIQISENTKQLPVSLIEKNPDIPWQKMNGLRNRIVHDYGSVKMDIIYNTVENDLVGLSCFQ